MNETSCSAAASVIVSGRPVIARMTAVRRAFFCSVLLLITQLLLTTSQAQTWLNWWAPEYTGLGVGGYVRACKLSNGNWLASLSYGANGFTVSKVYVSTNSCVTFEYLSTLSLTNENRQAWNPDLVQLPDGDILMAVNAWILDSTHHYGTNYQIRVYKSTNLGTNWAYLSTIDSNASSTIYPPDSMPPGLWEPAFHFGNDGRLVCLWSDESYQPTYGQVISESLSSNNGTNWTAKTTAAADLSGGGDRPGMPRVARMANGNYMMAFERTCCGAAYKTSSDGENWAAGLGTLVPDQHTAPFVCAMPDGRVFYTSGWGGPGSADTLKVSFDYGADWTQQISATNMINTFPSIYLSKPDEMVWLMGRSDNNGASVWRGSVNPAPVESTTTREYHLLQTNGTLRTFCCNSTNGSVWTRAESSPGGAWGSWTSLGGVGFRRLEAIQNSDGSLVCFGVGDVSSVWVNYTVSGTWQGWSQVGTNTAMKDIKAFRYPNNGRYVVFAMDGWNLWAISQTADGAAPNASWETGFDEFPGSGYTQMSTILLPNNAFAFVGVGNPSRTYLRYQSGYQQSWTGEIALPLPTSPWGGSQYFDCLRLFQYNDGRLTLFAGDGNTVWNISQTSTNGGYGTNWGTWTQIPGTKIKQFDAIKLSDERFALLAVDGANSIDQDVQASVGGSWGGWSNIGGGGFSRVDGGQLSDGRLYLFGNGWTDPYPIIYSPEWLKYQQTAGGAWYSGWTNLQMTIY